MNIIASKTCFPSVHGCCVDYSFVTLCSLSAPNCFKNKTRSFAYHVLKTWNYTSRDIFSSAKAPTTPANVDGQCPDEDWVERGGHCYYFYIKAYDGKSWQDAEDECQRLGGSKHSAGLVSIHDRVTNDWIYNTVKDMNVYAVDGIWVGLKRQDLGDCTLV